MGAARVPVFASSWMWPPSHRETTGNPSDGALDPNRLGALTGMEPYTGVCYSGTGRRVAAAQSVRSLPGTPSRAARVTVFAQA